MLQVHGQHNTRLVQRLEVIRGVITVDQVEAGWPLTWQTWKSQGVTQGKLRGNHSLFLQAYEGNHIDNEIEFQQVLLLRGTKIKYFLIFLKFFSANYLAK